MEIGTKLVIEGVPYRIVHFTAGTGGRYFLAIEHDSEQGSDIRNSVNDLIAKLNNLDDKKEIPKLVVDWFFNEKVKSGVSVSSIMSIKRNPTPAETQIRRLLKRGELIDTIVEVLAFAIRDKFWSGVLNLSISTCATPKSAGEPCLFEKIKNKMISERHSNIPEVHQQTEEELEGIITVE